MTFARAGTLGPGLSNKLTRLRNKDPRFYLVRFGDGHTALVFPGPDAIIEHPRRKARKGPARG
jgi:hypothetical protein